MGLSSILGSQRNAYLLETDTDSLTSPIITTLFHLLWCRIVSICMGVHVRVCCVIGGTETVPPHHYHHRQQIDSINAF